LLCQASGNSIRTLVRIQHLRIISARWRSNTSGRRFHLNFIVTTDNKTEKKPEHNERAHVILDGKWNQKPPDSSNYPAMHGMHDDNSIDSLVCIRHLRFVSACWRGNFSRIRFHFTLTATSNHKTEKKADHYEQAHEILVGK